jgi:hypothetical protein
MTFIKTAALRKGLLIAPLALAIGLGTSAPGATIQLGESGWQAHWHSSLNGLVDIDVIAVENNTIFIQKSAEFTQGAVNGIFPTIPITFRQIGDSTITNIVIDDEIVTNSTGQTWGGFVIKLIDGGDATFDPAATAASGGGGPIGWSIDPFTTANYRKDDTKLNISGGLVNAGEQWFPGGGADDGQLWINVVSGGADDRTVFTLKERPTVFIIPGPSALMCVAGVLGLVGRGRRRS